MCGMWGTATQHVARRRGDRESFGKVALPGLAELSISCACPILRLRLWISDSSKTRR